MKRIEIEQEPEQSPIIEITMLLVALAGLGVIVALAVTIAFSSETAAPADLGSMGSSERVNSTVPTPVDLTSS